jgi:threonine dehydrogenase-like Zn-dependent dehydrogenase
MSDLNEIFRHFSKQFLAPIFQRSFLPMSIAPDRMQALVYYRSVPRYLAARAAHGLWPRRFFASLAPLTLKQVPLTNPEAGWILLRNRLCGLCGSDLNLLRGAESFLLEPYASFPAILGHEIAAEIEWAPSDSQWHKGDRVAVEPILCCQVRGLPPCRFCAQGKYNLCESFTQGTLAPGAILGLNRDAGGGLAEFMTAHPSQLVRLPDELPDEIAVLTDSLASALQPVLTHLPPDDALVVVYGAGIIGQHVIRLLRLLNSRAKIIVVARYPFQQELAQAGGANVVLIKPNRRQLGEAVQARWLPTTLGGGNCEGGADFFFDCAGGGRALQEGLVALRSQGTYVLMATTGSVKGLDLSSLWFRELHLTGSSMYAYGPYQGRQVRTYNLAVDFLASGAYPADGLVTHIYPLRDYRQALQTAMDKAKFQSVKVALKLSAPEKTLRKPS